MSKRAVITGATKGIGRALAQAMWADGYSLAVCSRNAEELAAMAEAFVPVHTGQEFLWKATDVSDSLSLQAFAEIIRQAWTSLDVLVNNAGIFHPGEVLKEAGGQLETMMRTNVYSAYDLTRAVFPLLKARTGSHIFTMCSIASIKAYPNGGAYTISKFALLGLTKVLREELKPLGIKVTAIIAGATWSDSWKGAEFPETRLMPASDIVEAVMSAIRMSPAAVVEEILIRPQLGDL
jgi:short-subunit dehydrogenase